MSESADIPLHLGIILDGNRRWAKDRGVTTFQGHKNGADNLKKITKAAVKKGVKYVSAYVFSAENWERAKSEISYLMSLAQRFLTQELDELNREDIRLLWFGNPSKLSTKLVKAIRNAEESTKNNSSGTLCLCFNYGGYQEIADAFNKMLKDKKTIEAEVSPEQIEQSLYYPSIPPVDLVIRTSGEQRLSGFMLWRAAYAELYFVDKQWPDFNERELDRAFDFYKNRERRFGH